MSLNCVDGTEIFDTVMDSLIQLDNLNDSVDLYSLIVGLIRTLQKHGWMCVGESRYWDHALVQSALKDLHPDWDSTLE